MGVRLAQSGTGTGLAVPSGIMNARRTLLVALLLFAGATLLTGCGLAGGWAAAGMLALALGLLGAAGCSSSHDDRPPPGDASVPPDSRVPPGDGNGTWEACCNGGRIDTCFCPAGAACNYGWFTDCGGGTCIAAIDAACGDAGGDAGGGSWEPCCNAGRIETCYCPPDTACNYGWFTDCGAGTCVDPIDACPGTDAGAGTYHDCCLDHRVSSCYCPPGVVCNYVPYVVCPDGSCVDGFMGESCAGAADAGPGLP